jgi:hypothetical protein
MLATFFDYVSPRLCSDIACAASAGRQQQLRSRRPAPPVSASPCMWSGGVLIAFLPECPPDDNIDPSWIEEGARCGRAQGPTERPKDRPNDRPTDPLLSRRPCETDRCPRDDGRPSADHFELPVPSGKCINNDFKAVALRKMRLRRGDLLYHALYYGRPIFRFGYF